MGKRSLALLLMCLGALLAVPVMAAADTQDIIQPQNETRDQGFQAGTCIVEGVPGPPPAPCSPETPTIFYKVAGGHPPIGFTQYIIEHEPFSPLPSPPFPPGALLAPIPGEDIKEHTIRTLRVDLPPGLTVNPEATPRCSSEDFTAGVPGAMIPTCPEGSKVGVEKITLVTNQNEVEIAPGFKPPEGFVIPPQKELTEVDIFNLEPDEGEPAKFGFVVRKAIPIYLRTEVAWENDYHESFTIELPNTAEATGLSTLISRLVNFGRSGDGTYITNPTTCFDPNQAEYSTLYSTWFRAESYADPEGNFPQGYTAVEAKLPKEAGSDERVMQEGCETIPFDPSVEVDPGTNAVDSPAPATVTTKLPFNPAVEGHDGQMQSHVRKAEVSLPEGMGLNPAGAQGLVACTDAQFKKGVRVYDNECPEESKIGTVEVDSPPLAELLTGDVYVGTQNSNNPESGDLYRILIEAKNENEGIAARLVGRVKANNTTGQLTAEIYDDLKGQFTDQPAGLPQVPFEEIRLRFKGGPRAVLSSPPVCSAESTSSFEPWARPGTSVNANSKVTLSTDPTGGPCPATMAQRKFAPTFLANTSSFEAGAYSPFFFRLWRATDGQQEIKKIDVTLPKGLTGKLAGIPYCPENAIAAAVGKSGAGERANPSCSGDSYIGRVVTYSGTGSSPLPLDGTAYLAGPYKGAPLSMVTMTPAVAGPFDLGNVVIRVALHLDPETAQIRAVSDLIPDVYGGAKLDLRSIALDVDRDRFMINPTSCKPQAVTGTIAGGGADPANPAAFSSFAVTEPFQKRDCRKLRFKPKLNISLFGPTKRAKNPRLKAVLMPRKGDANIARTAVKMPRSLFLEQSHIGTVCTRPQLAAHNCPKASVYGSAWAKSPLLSKKLQGKVYLVSSDNELPDLLVDLRGQVDIHLRGVISSKRGGLKTVFRNVPDVPVSKFVLNMKGGKKSLLVNSQNTCARPQRAVLNIKGHNSRKVKNNRYKLNIVSCNKKGKR